MIIGVVTTFGQRVIRKYISNYATHSLYVAVGMCKTTDVAAATDTKLVKELDRAAATCTVSGDELTVAMSGVVDWEGEILEVGIFEQASGGTAIYRGLLSEDSATAKSRYLKVGDTISVSIVLDFAAGAFT